ncbi:hypothetical protein ABZV67_46710, partial [Streptomyces sp. NPDC005065]
MRDDGAVDLRYFNQTGWTAIFNGTETEIGRMVRVEAWDPATGTALVVDPKRGAMRPVTDYEDFSHLSGAGTCSFLRIAAAIGPYPSSAVLVGLHGGA